MTTPLDPSEITLPEALAPRYPSADLALAEAAALRASLSLPKGVVHVVSDVHGEYKKLRHIINNASGSLRPLVESLFAGEMTADEIQKLLATIYYPHEAIEYWRPTLSDPARLRPERPLPARAPRAVRGAPRRAPDRPRRRLRGRDDRDALAPRPRPLGGARRLAPGARPLGRRDRRRRRPRRPLPSPRPRHRLPAGAAARLLRLGQPRRL